MDTNATSNSLQSIAPGKWFYRVVARDVERTVSP
jgi:hypothetical protein